MTAFMIEEGASHRFVGLTKSHQLAGFHRRANALKLLTEFLCRDVAEESRSAESAANSSGHFHFHPVCSHSDCSHNSCGACPRVQLYSALFSRLFPVSIHKPAAGAYDAVRACPLQLCSACELLML